MSDAAESYDAHIGQAIGGADAAESLAPLAPLALRATRRCKWDKATEFEGGSGPERDRYQWLSGGLDFLRKSILIGLPIFQFKEQARQPTSQFIENNGC